MSLTDDTEQNIQMRMDFSAELTGEAREAGREETETPAVLVCLTRWVRLRLRAALWRQWKTPRRRRAALLELGPLPRLASNTAASDLGPWYLVRTSTHGGVAGGGGWAGYWIKMESRPRPSHMTSPFPESLACSDGWRPPYGQSRGAG